MLPSVYIPEQRYCVIGYAIIDTKQVYTGGTVTSCRALIEPRDRSNNAKQASFIDVCREPYLC